MSEEQELPEGWASVPFDEVLVELRNGISTRPELEPPGTPILRINAVRPGRVVLDDLRYLPDGQALAASFSVRDGDLLFTRYNGSLDLLGVCGMVRGLGKSTLLYPDKLMRARLREDVVLPSFVELYFQSPEARERLIGEAKSSAGQQGISGGDLKRQPVSIAPLPEQHRIVEKVEALLAQVNKAKDRLDRVKVILKRFRQAVLAAACSGRLTEEWRARNPEVEPADGVVERLKALHGPFGTDKRGNAAPPDDEAHDLDASDLPPTWTCTELLWLCEPGRPITYGILKPGPNQDGGVPYIRVADFPAGVIKVQGVHRTTKEIAEAYKRSTLRTGDVLLSIRGTYGRICVVPSELDKANITQDTARLTIHESVNAAYVVMYLRSQPVQNRMKRAAKGVAVHGVNIGDVRALQVALPPLQEQAEIVRRVDALLGVADTIETRLTAASTRAEKLPQSILSKAFKGELVPTEADIARAEGRAFESAEELLRRAEGSCHSVTASTSKQRGRQSVEPSRAALKRAPGPPSAG
ncbi:MAG TPA: restriction endonuclease subunit S [Polyangiaceae bacterium]|nr:restriction endonuclease subunit S [Polyangiaceae bacterium]